MSALVTPRELELAREAVRYQREQVAQRERSLEKARQWLANAEQRLSALEAEAQRPAPPPVPAHVRAGWCCEKALGCVCGGSVCSVHGERHGEYGHD